MIIVYILVGVISGVLGGMGMGGGTLLIPLLTLVLRFNQQLVQGINLISFCIMAGLVLIVHIKNGYVDIKNAIFFGIFAIFFAILGAFLASVASSYILKKSFGVLLIIISLYSVVCELVSWYNS